MAIPYYYRITPWTYGKSVPFALVRDEFTRHIIKSHGACCLDDEIRLRLERVISKIELVE